MSYKIKEIYFTQQGEGTNTGKDFVFVRFSGCNLWSGKEKNRASAICKFCDTDFYGTDGINGGVYSAKELIKRVKLLWLSTSKQIRVLCTGGEPLLQLDSDLISGEMPNFLSKKAFINLFSTSLSLLNSFVSSK